ncbi:MAG: glycosyltransferase family 2 protein [Alphaproteobacteria bacterium]|nr:glycosyltransferase family 2 protein [Alphaproteobacteria bacterium]
MSVVIATYDRLDYLAEAIESALAQTIGVSEVIVVDDASPVPPRPVVERFDDRVTYLRLQENVGACAARNVGIERASGTFIALLDDDDVWLPNKLERQLAAIGDREACLCGYFRTGAGFAVVRPGLALATEAEFRKGNRVCGTSGLVARRAAMLETPFDARIHSSHDWDVYVRLSQRGPIAYVGEPLFKLREGHGDRITYDVRSMEFADLPHQLAVVEKHRVWLGNKAYRARIADVSLRFLRRRRSKLPYLRYAIVNAGLGATLLCLMNRLLRVGARTAARLRQRAWRAG